MKNLTFSGLLELVASDGDDDGDDSSLPLEGLCCPDDPLDEVITLQDAELGIDDIWASLEDDDSASPRLDDQTRGGRGGDDGAGGKNAEGDVGGSAGGRAAGGEVTVPGRGDDGRGKDDAACKTAAEGMGVDAPAPAEVAVSVLANASAGFNGASAHAAVPKKPAGAVAGCWL
ncbi:hypothetical protein GUJ93_ZPchr0011g27475 [Zizania palustris]|uniref:Uncharacterized protein n=1 Tax=Zizania palustris TaxID=103762 RepID=A0A8J5WHB1_ZIZPA|nr:hypothetical protein GUJ93_ZPchr0011g27475 [Zizania palustris]